MSAPRHRKWVVASLVTGATFLVLVMWAWSLPVACSAAGGGPCGERADRNPAALIALSTVLVLTAVGVWAGARWRRGRGWMVAAILVAGIAGLAAVVMSTGFALSI